MIRWWKFCTCTSWTASKPQRSIVCSWSNVDIAIFLVYSYSPVFVEKRNIFFSPDADWKKQRFLLHAIYLSVISLLVAINIFLFVRRWRKPILKGNWNIFFPAKQQLFDIFFLKLNKLIKISRNKNLHEGWIMSNIISFSTGNFVNLTFPVLLFHFAKAKFTNLLGYLHYVQLFINHTQALNHLFFGIYRSC